MTCSKTNATGCCRERVAQALRHKRPGHLPRQISYTGKTGQALADHLGVVPERLPEVLGNHLLRVDLSYERQKSTDGRVIRDWWGVGYPADEEGYFIKSSPLAEGMDPASYQWPDPENAHLLDEARRLIEADGGGHFTIPNFGFALFERAWTLRGFETFMIDLCTDPEGAEALLERICEIQLVLVRRFIELKVDGGYFGDDYGTQQGLLIAPELWRTMIKPRLARLFEPFVRAGLPVIMHSDGQISELLPDLIEIGLTAINPVQPEIFDFAKLKKQFGHDLAFYGGISTQSILPHGSPAQVREAVRRAIGELAEDGTGLIVGPSHRMMSDIPLENILAMMEAIDEFA